LAVGWNKQPLYACLAPRDAAQMFIWRRRSGHRRALSAAQPSEHPAPPIR